MDKKTFAARELAKRGIGPDRSPAEDAPGLDESQAYDYTDAGHSDEPAGGGVKDAKRIRLEQEFAQKYDAYMRPEKPLTPYREQLLLEDLFTLLRKLNQKWAELKARRYREVFSGVDEEIPLQIGCAYAYEKLVEDKQNGIYIDHALAHYLRVAQNRAIDLYFRKVFGRLPQAKKGEDDASPEPARRREPRIVSLEAWQTTGDGEQHDDRSLLFSYDPFADMKRPYHEREEKSRKLAILYLQKLMDYPNEPQKPLAVMYGSCLFQLAKVMENDDRLTQMAKASTALSSKEWAFLKMGLRTLKELGDESAGIVTQYYGAELSWGSHFTRHMQERSETGSGYQWADIVYTQTYTKDQTSNWIESVSKSAILKAARAVKDDPDMVDYVMQTLGEKNRFRKALENKAKEEPQ